MSYSPAGSDPDRKPRLAPRTSLALPIDESSRVSEVRRMAVALADALGFSEAQQSNLAIVTTEAANNLLHHAGGGEIVLRGLASGESVGVELLALDKGPGIANWSESLQDGYSTGGTSGTGLGAIKRLSTSLAVYTRPDCGTALLATVWTRTVPHSRRIEIGVVSRPKPEQNVCGDSWAVRQQGDKTVFLVVDGLGHGPDAAQAAQAAVATFETLSPGSPGRDLESVHAALQGTRGAAAALAQIDFAAHVLCFAGAGNIAGVILQDEASVSMVSHYGIVGYQVRKFQEFTYACPAGSVVILSSDGVATLRNLTVYPGLLEQPAALIAGVLYRDFQRINDDATVLVIKVLEAETSS